MISINQIKSLVVLVCCFIISSISTASFAWGNVNQQMAGFQASNQSQVMVGPQFNNKTIHIGGNNNYSYGYENFQRPHYFQSLEVPYTSQYTTNHGGCPFHNTGGQYAHTTGYYTGYSFAYILALLTAQECEDDYGNDDYHRPKHLDCRNGSYKAYVRGQWTCHSDTVCEDDEYKVYENGQFVCKPRQIACTQEVRFCADGSTMPRDPDCTWRPDQCTGTQNPDCSNVTCFVGDEPPSTPCPVGSVWRDLRPQGACCSSWQCVPRRSWRRPRFNRPVIAIAQSNNNNQIQVENTNQNANQIRVFSSSSSR